MATSSSAARIPPRPGGARPSAAPVGSSRRRRRWRAVAVVLVAAALGTAPLATSTWPAAADERSDAVDAQQQAQQQQAELTASLEGVSAELGQAYLDLQSARTALSTAEAELTAAEDTLAQKQREQQTAADRLSVAQTDLDTLTDEADQSARNAQEHNDSVASMVVSAYQGDTTFTSWTYVLASDSVEDLSNRASTMEIASGMQESALAAAEAERARDANRKARQDAVTQRVAALKEEADTAERQAQEAADAAQTKRDEVAELETRAATAASDLEARKGDLEDQLRQSAADADAAAARIAEIDAANRAAYEAGQTGVSSATVAADSLGSGYIGHPITGELAVTSPFGWRIHPVTGAGTGHQGVDFAAAQGTPQYASAAGTVTYWDSASCGIGLDLNVGYVDGHSYVVTLCHLSGRNVANGQYVNRGDVIGFTGSTGYATGPHVHFQVAQDGVYIDPMTLPGF
ncbi:peptidoglycan DD-metalloendopeptidase family protein [uncultured Actinomyces sp.]|uniref:peptidoglycan DD-metalloendopeptidase family protein n=1 Tax=uncultured Actinomyces sp. TaxID=249061 RepID=UPI0028894C6C|nr:peptidoglycan DD-metalloendopeptidase family protein [uncultured Actinomyces sp.]